MPVFLTKVHKKGKDKFASAKDMKVYRWSRGLAPLIFNLGTK